MRGAYAMLLKGWKLLARAKWSRAYIDALPDSAFLYVEPGGSKDDEGKTEPRDLRHFPYKDENGDIDEAHLDDALSRIPQSDLPQEVKDEVSAKAEKIKARLSKEAGDVDPAKQAAAVVDAYHAALTEHELELPPGGFSLWVVADSDGDGDAGDPTTLYCVSDRYACWYVLCEGVSARVIAFYALVFDGWCDEEMFAYSDELAPVAKHLADPPADNAERDAWLVAALQKAGDEEPVAKSYRPIAKDDTQRYTLGVAYFRDEVDSHGDFTDEAELEQAAWNFMRDVVAKGEPGVGVDHADGTDGAAQVVESYIYRGPDWTGEDGEVIAKTGDWLVGAIWTPEAWAEIDKGDGNGRLTGWSIQGLAMLDEDAEAPGSGD